MPETVSQLSLTPRSEEACRIHGVVPSELLPRDISDFKQLGLTPEAQHRRWQAYEQARADTFKLVQSERERLIAEAGDKKPRGSPMRSSTSAGRLLSSSLSNSSLGARDTSEAALEKLQRRQQLEMEQTLLQELRTSQASLRADEKQRAAATAEENRRRQRSAKAREGARLLRKWDEERRLAEVRAEKEVRARLC